MSFWAFWWQVFLEALVDSFKVVGKEPSDIVFSIIVFVLVGVLLLWRDGWPKAWADMKRRSLSVIGQDALIVFALFVLIVGYHLAKDSYLRWKEADDRAQQVSQEYQTYKKQTEKNKPDLKPRIFSVGVGPAGDKGNAVIGVFGSINNVGTPGSPAEFWLDVKFDDGRVLHGQIAAGSNITGNPGVKSIFGKNAQGATMSLPISKYFYNSMSEVIPTYGHLDGFLMALVRGTTKEEIMDKQPTLVWTCSDVTGAKSSADQRFSGPSAAQAIGLQGLQKHVPK